MIISVNWLKKLTSIDMPINELAVMIGARLVEIEDIVNLGAKYKGIVVARVVEAAPIEGSDHLNVTKLDDGGVTSDVERDENGYVQVVCGAPNVRSGLYVAWLPPKTIVPETAEYDEPFILDTRKIRGVTSNGMIASARELALFDEHEGILELDADVTPGMDFAKAYELDDYLLNIENKSLTHRPDCFGVVGFAREIAAIQGKTFTTPKWLMDLSPEFGEKQGNEAAPMVMIDDAELSDRYQAVVLSNTDGKKNSPLWMQTYLGRVGVRPISAIVDVTNYLMLLTGQPLHAFDYDKVVSVAHGDPTIHVRAGHDKESLTLLDGRTIELTSGDIVIAAGGTPIGLAGAMGGANTEIDEHTKRVILESATFNLYNLRSTQMRHGIFSEAVTRFTKGQPADLTAPVLAEAIALIAQITGSTRVSDVADVYPGKREIVPITVTAKKVNGILGTDLVIEDMLTILKNAEFPVSMTSGDDTHHEVMVVNVPYWRGDIHIDEDVVEEIGRLYGFDSISPVLPVRDFTAVAPADFDTLRASIRQILVRAGANEVLTYSFIHGDILKKADQDPKDSYRITNSISPDLQYYRQSITPSLLGLVRPNSKNGYDNFALFELNKVHHKSADLVDGNVPAEMHRLGAVITYKKAQSGAAYYYAKHMLEYLCVSLGMKLAYKPFAADTTLAFTRPFDLKRSARIVDVISGQSLGIVGEYKKTVVRQFKLPPYTAGFELLTEAISLACERRKGQYSSLSRYPSTERDICFQVEKTVSYQDIKESVQSALNETTVTTNISPVDIYQTEDSSTKNITIRITFTSYDHTLTSNEVQQMIAHVTNSVASRTGARVI